MSKAAFVLLAILFFQVPKTQAQNLRSFIKNCAWGSLLGAGAGVVSLAFVDKPGESWNNVAKGASLGLYSGIAYGLYDLNREPDRYQQPDFAVAPIFSEGKVDGVQMAGILYSF